MIAYRFTDKFFVFSLFIVVVVVVIVVLNENKSDICHIIFSWKWRRSNAELCFPVENVHITKCAFLLLTIIFKHIHTLSQHIYIIEMMCLISIINRRSLEIDYIWKWLFWFVDWQICSLICAQPFRYVREILHHMRMSRWDSIPSTSHGIYSTVHMISLHRGGTGYGNFPFLIVHIHATTKWRWRWNKNPYEQVTSTIGRNSVFFDKTKMTGWIKPTE